jgi:hypothetical protein
MMKQEKQKAQAKGKDEKQSMVEFLAVLTSFHINILC